MGGGVGEGGRGEDGVSIWRECQADHSEVSTAQVQVDRDSVLVHRI